VAIAGSLETEVVAGRLTRDAALGRMRDVVNAIRYDGGLGYLTILDSTGLYIAKGDNPASVGTRSTAKDDKGRQSIDLMTDALRTADEGRISYSFAKPGQTERQPKISYVTRFRPWDAFIQTGAYYDDIDAAFRSSLVTLGEIGGVVLLVGILGSWLVTRDITRSLSVVEQALERLVGGDLTSDIPGLGRRDEVGGIARAMLVFRGNARQTLELQADVDKAREAKDRRQAAMDRDTHDFGGSIAGVMASLGTSAEAMRTTASTMSATARQTRTSAARTAEAATASSRNLGAVSTGTEQMSASIAEISRQTARGTNAVRGAVHCAGATDTKVAGLAQAADRIGDVVRLISSIAGQTNLLALNATIEAARAGDAGKGFAVVANEVKALAAQTARATTDIGTQIAAIGAATAEAVDAVRDVVRAIGQVDEVTVAIAAAVEHQASATRDIATSIQTVTVTTDETVRSMNEVCTVSEATEAAGRDVLAGADDVARTAATLKIEVDQFLSATARAAA
jgi:methyl-accepting chemotaxis protein